MMTFRKHKRQWNIHIFAVLLIAVVFCVLFPFGVFADDETDHIVIAGEKYTITDEASLIQADLALIRWDAEGNITTDENTLDTITGQFDGELFAGYWAVYEEIYSRLLTYADSSFKKLSTSKVTVASGETKIYRFYKDESAEKIDITWGSSVSVSGTLLFLAEGEADLNTMVDSYNGSFTVSSGGTFVIQGRSQSQTINIKGKTTSTKSGDLIKVSNGNLYLANCHISDYKFGGNSVVRLSTGNATRKMYMANSSFSNVSATEAGGLFCTVYNATEGGSQTAAAQSKVFIHNSTFSKCTTSGGNTIGGSAIRSYAADRCQLTVTGCTFDQNSCTATGNASGGGAIYWKSALGKATLKGCTFTDNSATKVGGAIYNTGDMSIEDCYFEGNRAGDSGGAIAVEPPYTSSTYGGIPVNELSGSLSLDATTKLINNEAGDYGGGIYFNAYASQITSSRPINTFLMELEIDGATIQGNSASYGGGIAIWLDYKSRDYTTGITIKDGSKLQNNEASQNGGAIWMSSDTDCDCKENKGVLMSGGVLQDNTAANGGALFISTGKSGVSMDFRLNGGFVQDNQAIENGGAAYVQGGNFVLGGGTISDCTATENGGGVYLGGGEVNIVTGNMIRNTAKNGGAAYVQGGNFTVSGGTISYCEAIENGGAAYVQGGNFTLSGGTVTKCIATENGGGVYLGGGEVIVTAGRLTACTAKNGGGAYVSASSEADGVIVSGGEISGNFASLNGGGIAVNNGFYKMTGGEVKGNEATSGSGGGIYVAANGVDVLVDIRSGSVSNNKAGVSGGAVAVIGQKNGTENIVVTVGVNKRHYDDDHQEIVCDHDYTEGDPVVTACPVLSGNVAVKTGGGVYITGGKTTALNTYCLVELDNQAADGMLDSHGNPDLEGESTSDFMMVDGGKVVISTADVENGYVDNAYGKITINNRIHVYAGDVVIYGSMSSPEIIAPITVDVTAERGSYSDMRTPDGGYYKIQYFENFTDPETGLSTGQYTVFQIKHGNSHVILPSVYQHDGYEIDGWWTSEFGDVPGSIEYLVNHSYTFTNESAEKPGDLVLYAKWLTVGYYVYFDAGTTEAHRGAMEGVRYTYDTDNVLPENLFFRPGWLFAGWNYEGNTGALIDDEATVRNLTTEKSITLVAEWVVCTHAEELFSYSLSGTNVLIRTCYCESCTQTATLNAENTVYVDGNTVPYSAELRVVTSVTNGKQPSAWTPALTYDGHKYSGAAFSAEEFLIGAGEYSVSMTEGGKTVVLDFEIEKAENITPSKPEYESYETDQSIAKGMIRIVDPLDTSGFTLRYRIVWHDDMSVQHTAEADLAEAITTGFALDTNYTNYYVYVRYEADDNHLASEWVRAEEILFYEGNVYIFINCEQGIDYTTEIPSDDRGLIIHLQAAEGYYLYNVEITDDNAATDILTEVIRSRYYIDSIPNATDDTIEIHVVITGVKKEVDVTSKITASEEFGTVSGSSATITRDSAYTVYFEIENYAVYVAPKLKFSSELPQNTTLILLDKTTAAVTFWTYTVTDATDVVLLSDFKKMGTFDVAFSVPSSSVDTLKYQLIVDFSDSVGCAGDTLETVFSADRDAESIANGAIEFAENPITVSLKSCASSSVVFEESNASDGEPSGKLYVEYLTTAAGATSSKWNGRAGALVITPLDTLPSDARIVAVDETGMRTVYYRNLSGQFIISLGTAKSETLTVKLLSELFPSEETEYRFNVALISSDSLAGTSPSGGAVLVASQTFTLVKAANAAETSLSIEGEKTVYALGENVVVNVDALNLPDNTVLVLKLLRKTRSENGEIYVDTGWKQQNDTVLGDNEVPLGQNLTGSLCIVLELRDTAGNVLDSVPYYFVVH